VVRGHLELLELDGSADDRRETIALVVDELDRMGGLVDALFLIARSEQPDFLQLEPVDLRELVVDVQRKATALAPRDWQVHAPGAVEATGDPKRLTQALLQLAHNAVRFTEPGDAVRIGADVCAGEARLWVDDTGTGVAPEEAARIFERYRRGGPTLRPTGAGLGLAIVQAIVEAHGGRIRLVDRDQPGARFEISLPVRGPVADGSTA